MLTSEQILDKIIALVCEKFNVEVADVSKKHSQYNQRAKAEVAEVKKIVCYLQPVLVDIHYRKLLKKLGYFEQTSRKHTTNRKQVISRMEHDYYYKQLVQSIKEEAKKAICNCVRAGMHVYVKNTDLPVVLTVDLKFTKLSVQRNIDVP